MSSMVGAKIIGGILLALSVCGIITVSVIYKVSGGKIPFQYGVILDAGSTKTQVTLYKWEGQKDEGTGIVSQVNTCKAKGGLHVDIFSANEAIIPCLENVSSSVPKEEQTSTPLYLGATAGMRMLRLKDPYLADILIFAVKYMLSQNSNFLVKDVGIISGRDEGMFAWVTGNFLLDTLHKEEHDSLLTYGALDMGGASTQVSFELPPRDSENIDNTTTLNMKLYGRDHLVFAQSYLCYGINEAMRRYRAMIAKDKTGNEEVADPCGFKDDIVNRKASDLFGHQCTKHLVAKGNMDTVYKFKGTGNNKQCSVAIKKLINNKECKDLFDSPCFSTPKEKLSDVKYVAVSTFYHTASALNVTNSTLQEYEKAFHDYCTLSRKDAVNKLDPRIASYAGDYCLETHYVHYILTKEYGFNETTWQNIEFVIEVDGSDLGWSLGYMINATNAIPKGKPTIPLISYSTFIILLVISSLLLITGILTILLSPRSHQSTITVIP